MFKQDEKPLMFMLKWPRCPNELANITCSLPQGTYPGNMAETLCRFC